MLILCQYLLVRIFAHCFFSWFVQELYLAWNASTRTSLRVHFFGSITLSVSIKMYRMISSGSMDIQKNVMTFLLNRVSAGMNQCYLNQTHFGIIIFVHLHTHLIRHYHSKRNAAEQTFWKQEHCWFLHFFRHILLYIDGRITHQLAFVECFPRCVPLLIT